VREEEQHMERASHHVGRRRTKTIDENRTERVRCELM
jgi:hypothetical protein